MDLWLAALLAPSLARAGVVFNEILADPGDDASCDGTLDTTDDEFVEIVNVGPGAVDLTGATISDATSVRFTFPALVLQEGDAVVVFGGATPVLDGSASGLGAWCVGVGSGVTVLTGGTLGLNNTGDDLTLTASGGAVLTQASYGSAAGNDTSLVLAPELFGASYVRHDSLTAVRQSPGAMVDLGPFDLTPPGTTPVGGCDAAVVAQGLVINELVSNPSGTDTGYEWVELYNGSGNAVDLSGWTVASGTSSYSDSDPFPNGTVLPDGGHLLVGQEFVTGADVVVGGFSLGNASNSDAVQLRDCYGAAVDTVVYGDPNDDGWQDDTGAVATSLGPVPPENRSIGRMPNGRDTDQSGVDFQVLSFTTPGRANDGPPDTCGGPESGVKLNEVQPNPDGADEGLEWVELYHAGSAPVDLSGWALQMGTSSFSTKYTWKSGVLMPGEFLLLGGVYVPGADVVVESMSLGNATSNTDGVRLVDCLGFPADTLVYGSPNDGDTPFVDDSGGIAVSLAPAPGEGASLQRVTDGYDTDQCAVDWVVTLDPTPGATNPPVAPVVCVPSTGAVVLNEILPDPDGADEGAEFVELYNNGDVPADVSGWAFSAGTSDFDSLDVVLGGGVVIPPKGFLVIGGELVEPVDVILPFSLGNGTETDGVRLYDCAGTAVDTVLYGDSPNADLLTDDLGQVVEPYGDPGSDESLARQPDGVDTDAAEDWVVKGRPTPGETNVVDLGEIEDPTRGRGCGCGGGAPDPGQGPEAQDPNAGGCSVAPVGPTGPLTGLLLLLAIGLRRRG